ncbi:NADPH-dependent oxidoreductase [Robbsia sp. KACC 23696]|uniref:NADPH-dependent oxidoreductase n=1 Tax=Robbsia sp. KACC 23696 TaxID=3149231 RepID=UPI00325ADE5D
MSQPSPTVSTPVSRTDAPASEAIQAAYFQRYREAVPTQQWSETLGLMLDHRSVRSFLSTPLAEGTVEALVAAASSAPTSSNVQAWSVVAVSDAATRAQLAELAGGQKHIVDAPLILVWIADLARADAIGKAAGQPMETLGLAETGIVAIVDAILAAQNALVAAESLGLGTVYIGALRNDPARVAALLGLPAGAWAVAGLVIGHPDPTVATAVKPRLPQRAVLHRERYHTDQQAAIADHDVATEAFRAEQGLPSQSWTTLLLGRLGPISALKGRHLLRETLAKLGVPLA